MKNRSNMRDKVLHKQELKEPYLRAKKTRMERKVNSLIAIMIKDIAATIKEDSRHETNTTWLE